MKRADYKFVLKTCRGNALRTISEKDLTEDEMRLFVKGVLWGAGARLKFSYVDVYNSQGELIYKQN